LVLQQSGCARFSRGSIGQSIFETKGLGLTPQRIGIFGGAFDPPHKAHVAMAEAAIAQFHLDELFVVPTGNAWHKPRDLSSGEHRAAMARLAFSHLRHARVDEIELHREGASYTIDTIDALQREQPGAELFLVMGADQWAAFTTWRQWQAIAGKARLCVAERPDQAGVCDERAKGFFASECMKGCRQEVGFSYAESPIEVDPKLFWFGLTSRK
jgi:nicotinate (nicotinamide) nucleotide adenylyltransferase